MTDKDFITKPPPLKAGGRVPIRIYCEQRFGACRFPEVLRPHISPHSALPSHWQRDRWASELCAEHNAGEVQLTALEISPEHYLGVGVNLPPVDHYEDFDADSGRILYPNGRYFIATMAEPVERAPAPPAIKSYWWPLERPLDRERAEILYNVARKAADATAWTADEAFVKARARQNEDWRLQVNDDRRRRAIWSAVKARLDKQQGLK